jgi:uncharacterized protein (TIGR02646 family)
MRKFQRAPEPEVLQQNSERWTDQWIELLNSSAKARFTWYQIGGRTAREYILPILAEQTSYHCSFCDAFPVGGVSKETIEHFRPKSQFPKLAYSWINLYYSCDACQSAKGELWDELLLNPDEDNYSCSRYFEYDFTTGEIKPKTQSTEQDQRRAMKTIELYGLDSQQRRRNRLIELRKRSRTQSETGENQFWAYRDFLGLDT